MNIYVRNLSPETSRSELLGCFETFGKVTDVTISTYNLHGKSRGLGFIEMPSNDQGQAAIAGLQGKELCGNLLKIQSGWGDEATARPGDSG
ncbi:MAG: RNA-binding protein [Candidatus Zixiibacteriota bacterium]|nr:MAG: RNA-binding protein [candidate division Zixibacteria bacterium]